MTTILGMKTNSGEEGIVVAADTKLAVYDNEEEIMENEKITKIRVGSFYAIAFSGVIDNYLETFFRYISKKKNYQEFVGFVSKGEEMVAPKKIRENPINEAIKRKYFEALNIFNRYMVKRDKNDIDGTIELILAVNKPKLNLYRVDAFGNLLNSDKPGGLEYVCGGSGASSIKDFFQNNDYKKDPTLAPLKISMDNINVATAVRLATRAMRVAAKDPETGDLIDLVILRKNKIYNYESKATFALDRFYEQLAKKYE
jgi:20S proteasome alpha/beta subunit